MIVWNNRKLIKSKKQLESKCSCCGNISTHFGEADGRNGDRVIVIYGCELRVRRWVRDGRSVFEMNMALKTRLAMK